MTSDEWWRSAVIYQVYPRSFADANGDGVGDLAGITKRMPAIVELGVDALWLSPFYTSPQRDAGYDVADYCAVDPLFGTLADFDALLAEAHAAALRVIVDLVPNHTSTDHAWFQQALADGPGSEARDHYLFRDGKGPNGDAPPNNWQSVFGGPAWARVKNPDGTPGQWYLHLFDPSQADLNWRSEWVREQFRRILRFWLDRGVDGFRVDVAHGLIKKKGLPDYTPPEGAGSMGGTSASAKPHADAPPPSPPYWQQPEVHAIYRDWHNVLDEYGQDRALIGEAWVEPLSLLADWVRPGEMQQTFNFAYLETPWKADQLRTVITNSLEVFSSVGAPSTWVLSNHDVVRHPTRLSLTVETPQGKGVGPNSPGIPDVGFALRRGRAATALMLALPGSGYLYQGEELGLPEDVELPDSARRDPTWFRSKGTRYGRDGCRVPIPWQADAPAYGFNDTGASWLPQPALWAEYARDVEETGGDSTLALYKRMLALRRDHGLGTGTLTWVPGFDSTVIAYRNGNVTVISNLGTDALTLPEGSILLASEQIENRKLPQDTTVWLSAD